MTLNSKSEIKSFLTQNGLNPNKGLGQHFLCSTEIVQKIVAACDGAHGILEIGPGPGILTHLLARDSREVWAIEIDERMDACLQKSAPSARIQWGDALVVDWALLLQKLPSPKWIVSNMPYYLSGALLQKTAQMAKSIDGAVLMMQTEVAERILAAPGNRFRGSLSVYLQSHFEMTIVADVPNNSFIPPPNVESKVVQFIPNSRGPISDDFFLFVQAGFKQPRKTLANNLSSGLQLDKERVESAIAGQLSDRSVRPHFLTLEQWQMLYQSLH